MKTVTAFAPASIGNVAAGFDILGAALAPIEGEAWGDRVTITAADEDRFECTGAFASRLPASARDNLVLKAKAFFEERVGRRMPPSIVRLEKRLPVNSGLGSSASSSVASLVACNAFVGEPLSKLDLLVLAGRAEGEASGSIHLDNAAPILLGGLQLCAPNGEVRALPFPDDLVFVLAQPELELSTRESRGALPREMPLSLAVHFAQNLAAFVHALHAGDRALLTATFRDLVAEPHRASLVRGFRAVQGAALDAGALACSLSGSGPAVFAVASDRHSFLVGAAMQRAFASADVGCTIRACRLDLEGARCL